MQLTTENIIKILAKNTEQAVKFLNAFESLNQDQKFYAEREIWNVYDFLYEERIRKNLEQALIDVRNRERKLSQDLYQQIKEQTDKELEQEIYNKSESADLAGVRDKISKIIGNSAS